MISEFIKSIQDRHGDKIAKSDYESMHRFFSGLEENSLSRLFEKYKSDYDDSFSKGRGMPTVPRLRKFAHDENIPLHLSANGRPAIKCDICGLIYASKRDRLSGTAFCPRCGEMGGSIVLNCDEDLITFAQDWCWKCPIYSISGKNKYGPGCEYYGSGKEIQDCAYCVCRKCCKANTYRPIVETQDQRQERLERTQKTWQHRREFNLKISKKYENISYCDIIRAKHDKEF